MNYTMIINQKAIIDSGLDIDPKDAVLITAISGLFADNSDTIIVGGLEYKEISPDSLEYALPILRLKKDAIVKRMKHLENIGVIERCPQNQTLAASYFRRGPNWGLLF